ncbi:MAG: murein DD-endopeptidase MepM/ murein hydrolase activator NlpD [Saprospiraceae bacterium]|jgi:murein DD-endopeptidase MepM/ murein hydrolase activator NlpD
MKFIIPFFLIAFSVTAQETVKVYHEQAGMGVNVYADNNEVIPMTVDLKLTLEGMESDIDNDKGLIVIPGKSKKFLLTKTRLAPNSREMTFAMDSKVYMGDITLKPDLNYVYALPFSKEDKVQIYQGYNGSFSHSGEKALDFGLDIGDKVLAARGGIVYKVIDSNSKSCKDKSCMEYNNVVMVYHEADGTSAEYVHLDHNGANVKVGDVINKGDVVGRSGNTGWSSGPHLHFMVYQFTKKGDRKSFKTLFATDEKNGVYLKEKQFYER